jgi:hypothetical protein
MVSLVGSNSRENGISGISVQPCPLKFSFVRDAWSGELLRNPSPSPTRRQFSALHHNISSTANLSDVALAVIASMLISKYVPGFVESYALVGTGTKEAYSLFGNYHKPSCPTD